MQSSDLITIQRFKESLKSDQIETNDRPDQLNPKCQDLSKSAFSGGGGRGRGRQIIKSCSLLWEPGVCSFCWKFAKLCLVRKVFWRMHSIVFFTLKLPIQTLLSMAPTRSVFWHATQFQQNEHTSGHKNTCTSEFGTSPSKNTCTSEFGMSRVVMGILPLPGNTHCTSHRVCIEFQIWNVSF